MNDWMNEWLNEYELNDYLTLYWMQRGENQGNKITFAQRCDMFVLGFKLPTLGFKRTT